MPMLKEFFSIFRLGIRSSLNDNLGAGIARRSSTRRILMHPAIDPRQQKNIKHLGGSYVSNCDGLFPIFKARSLATQAEAPKYDSYDKLMVRNLAFKGGGSKALAYGRALQRLENVIGSLDGIKRVVGTSAGSIVATFLSVGYNPAEIHGLLLDMQERSQEFLTYKGGDPKSSQLVESLLTIASSQSSLTWKILEGLVLCASHLNETTEIIRRIRDKRGLFSGDEFREWLDETIARKVSLNEHGKEDRYTEYKYLTFGKLKALKKTAERRARTNQYKDLYVVYAQYTQNQEFGEVICKSSTHPSYIISDAVRVSMSIPGVFYPSSLYRLDTENGKREPDEEGGCNNVDGGILRNYAVDIFDSNRYLYSPNLDQPPDSGQVNYQTIGFNLKSEEPNKVEDWAFSYLFFKKVRSRNDQDQNQGPLMTDDLSIANLRNVTINTHDISLLNFILSEESIRVLDNEGDKAVADYFRNQGPKLRDIQITEGEKNNVIKKEIINDVYSLYTNLGAAPLSKYHITRNEYNELAESLGIKKGNFEEASVQWVTGFSGTGKSDLTFQAAHEYFNYHLHNGWKNTQLRNPIHAPIIWVINATSKDEIYKSYSELARRLIQNNKSQLSPRAEKRIKNDQLDESSKKPLLDFIQKQLQAHPNWMLIFNNANLACEDLTPFFFTEKGQKGIVLISSQNTPRVNGLKTFNLNKGMSDSDAEAFFKGIDREGCLDGLIKTLHNQPLALSAAAAYFRESGDERVDYDDYLKQYKESREMIKREKKITLVDLTNNDLVHEVSLWISMNKFYVGEGKGAEDTRLLLYFCALLPGHKIKHTHLKDLLRARYKNLKSEVRFKQIVAESLSPMGSLLTGEEELYQMHNLVQDTIKLMHVNLLEEKVRLSHDKEIISLVNNKINSHDGRHQWGDVLISLVGYYAEIYPRDTIPTDSFLDKPLCNLYKNFDIFLYKEGMHQLDDLYSCANSHYKVGEYEASEKTLNDKIFPRLTSAGLSGTKNEAAMKNLLVNIYCATGREKEAESICYDAITIYAKLGLHGSHVGAADAQYNLARIRNASGKKDDAKRLYKAALATYKRLGSSNSNRVANVKEELESIKQVSTQKPVSNRDQTTVYKVRFSCEKNRFFSTRECHLKCVSNTPVKK